MSQISNSLRRTWAIGCFSLSRLVSKPIKEIRPVPYVNKSRICQNFSKHQRSFSSNPGDSLHRPSDFEKRVLVYNGAYPSVDKVPDEVTKSKMLRAKDWFRIRVNIGMAIATVIACIGLIYSGKKAAKSGQNVTEQNLEMHRQYQERMAAAKK